MNNDRLNHSLAVANKMVEIGKSMGLSEVQLKELFILGYNHDIGYQFGNNENHNIIGGEILKDILLKNDINIKGRYNDCGILMFDSKAQDTHAGGSGCGCCGSVFAGYLYDKLQKQELNKILLVATGALMSPTAIQQGEAIEGIAHAVAIEN